MPHWGTSSHYSAAKTMAADTFYITDGDQLKLSGGMIMVTEAPATEPTTEATTQQTETVA